MSCPANSIAAWTAAWRVSDAVKYDGREDGDHRDLRRLIDRKMKS